MKMKTISLFLFSLLFTLLFTFFAPIFEANAALSAGTFPLKEVKFDLNADNVILKTEEALANPEEVLKEYQPVDAVITNKVVRGNIIEFDATKNILGIKKTAHVYGILTVVREDKLCPGKTLGFNLLMDLMNSNELVYKNIEKLTATLCFNQKNELTLLGHSTGLMYKSDDYNRIEGAVIKSFIDNQVGPIIKALKIVVER